MVLSILFVALCLISSVAGEAAVFAQVNLLTYSPHPAYYNQTIEFTIDNAFSGGLVGATYSFSYDGTIDFGDGTIVHIPTNAVFSGGDTFQHTYTYIDHKYATGGFYPATYNSGPTSGTITFPNGSVVDFPNLWGGSPAPVEVNVNYVPGPLILGTPENPLLPTTITPRPRFFIRTPNVDAIGVRGRIYIDPGSAPGYDFTVLNGPAVASIAIPEGTTEPFTVRLAGMSDIVLTPGIPYSFGPGGVTSFTVLDDPAPFLIGLSFIGDGDAELEANPIRGMGGSSVPEPSSFILLATGMAGLFAVRRRCGAALEV